MRILITRPEPAASRFAARLQQAGIGSVVAPLTAIVPVEGPLRTPEGLQALLFTSANGVRAYAARGGRADLPAYVVGDATAEAARNAGFAEVASAAGDWRDLAALVKERRDPAKGPLLHPAGEDRAGDLAGALRKAGFDLVQEVVYRAAPAANLPEAAEAALAAGEVEGVALFSPRSAGIFVAQAAAAGLGSALARLDAFCISAAVAAVLQADGVAFRSVRVAARPNAEAMAELIRVAARAQDTLREDRKAMTDDEQPQGAASEAEQIIAAFGGIRPMAKALGIAVTTVQGWKERGAIPLRRMPEIRQSAANAGIDLDAALAETGTVASDAAGVESLDAEKLSPGPEPGLRAAEAPPPPPPAFDATPPAEDTGRWRWAMFGAGFGAAFVAGAIVAIMLGLGGGNAGTVEREALDRLQSRINSITSQLEDQQKRQQSEATSLQARLGRIDAAERAIGEQRERLAGLAATSSALASRLEKLDMDVKALAARTPAGADDVKALREQVAALAKRIETLPKEAPDAAGRGALAAELKQFGERLARLERQTGELAKAPAGDDGAWKEALTRQSGEAKAAFDRLAEEARASAARLQAESERLQREVAALQARLGALAADVQRTGSDTGALLVAIGQLRRAVLEGAPYRAALDSVAALAKGREEFRPALARLAERAGRGIPTLAQLRARFDRVGVAVLRAEAAPGADAGLWERVWSRLRTLVTVRRTGDAEGPSTAARVSRAEAALARGDLAAAVKELEGLDHAAKAADWLADAKARLAADAALAELGRASLALLGRPQGQPEDQTRQ